MKSRKGFRFRSGLVPGFAGLSLGASVMFGGPSMLHAHSDVGVSDATQITVYKSPTCGCCSKWVDHLRRHGFRVIAKDTADVDAVKAKLGVPSPLHSCHTAVVRGYVVEGHVPADVIQRLLKEKPKVVGIAVPGMPAGSPGMEMGSRKDSYNVVAFTSRGASRVFAKR